MFSHRESEPAMKVRTPATKPSIESDSPLTFTPGDINTYAKRNDGIFLAGPTPRSADVLSWRLGAVQEFKKLRFNSSLFLPEPFCNDRDAQIDWETHHLALARVIMFWIPRSLATLPGFTTNIEFGEWMKSGKVVLGIPSSADKVSYIEYRAAKLAIPVYRTLDSTVLAAVRKFKSLS
jgi:hypothetical protein